VKGEKVRTRWGRRRVGAIGVVVAVVAVQVGPLGLLLKLEPPVLKIEEPGPKPS